MDVPIVRRNRLSQRQRRRADVPRRERRSRCSTTPRKLPDANILWSPRVGFNVDVSENRTTQLRGGTGIFTGKPLFVWISNQIGNTGVLTGFSETIGDHRSRRSIRIRTPTSRPTSPARRPPATSWRSPTRTSSSRRCGARNIAVDQRLPWGITGTAEFIYNRDVNGVYYINANLPAAQTTFAALTRARWTTRRAHGTSAAASIASTHRQQRLERHGDEEPERRPLLEHGVLGAQEHDLGHAAKPATTTARARTPSIRVRLRSARGAATQHSGDPNNPGLAFADRVAGTSLLPGRFVPQGVLRLRRDLVLGVLGDRARIGNASYIFSGDLNGDGGTANDLLYIHRNVSEMNFSDIPAAGRSAFTAEQQAAAWEALHRSGSVPERASRRIRRARRRVPAARESPRLQRHAGCVREPRRRTSPLPVPRRHHQLRQPAEQRTGASSQRLVSNSPLTCNAGRPTRRAALHLPPARRSTAS